MRTTKQIPREEWKPYFDAFTQRHLRDDRPETATVEVVSSDLGAQINAYAIRLRGISYDPKDEALDIYLDNVDGRARHPKEIWVEEEDDGFLDSVEIIRDDDSKQIITLRRRYPLTPA